MMIGQREIVNGQREIVILHCEIAFNLANTIKKSRQSIHIY